MDLLSRTAQSAYRRCTLQTQPSGAESVSPTANQWVCTMRRAYRNAWDAIRPASQTSASGHLTHNAMTVRRALFATTNTLATQSACLRTLSFVVRRNAFVCLTPAFLSQSFRMPWELQEMLWHQAKRMRGMLRAILPILVDMHLQWDFGRNQLWEIQKGR